MKNLEDKICMKCKYFHGEYRHLCHNPKTSKFSPVTGYDLVMCEEARSHTVGKCGPLGTFFEQAPEVPIKKSFWKRLVEKL